MFDAGDTNIENWITTCLAVIIGGFRFWRGLEGLVSFEKVAVDGKLNDAWWYGHLHLKRDRIQICIQSSACG